MSYQKIIFCTLWRLLKILFFNGPSLLHPALVYCSSDQILPSSYNQSTKRNETRPLPVQSSNLMRIFSICASLLCKLLSNIQFWTLPVSLHVRIKLKCTQEQLLTAKKIIKLHTLEINTHRNANQKCKSLSLKASYIQLGFIIPDVIWYGMSGGKEK